MARFRLVPHDNSNDQETGLLRAEDQHTPWASSRNINDKRPPDYLRRQFYKQLEDAPVRYRLQIQVRGVKGPDNEVEELFNPQNVSMGLVFADAITSILVFSSSADNISIGKTFACRNYKGSFALLI